MAKKPNNNNNESLVLYNRQGKNITEKEAKDLIAKHPELPDMLTEVFFTPSTTQATVKNLLDSNESYSKTIAHAADRDAAIAAKLATEDTVREFADGLGLDKEWLKKAKVTEILQAVKDKVKQSLEAAVGKTTSSKPKPKDLSKDPEVKRMIAEAVAEARQEKADDLNNTKTELIEANSKLKSAEGKISNLEQALALADQRAANAATAVPVSAPVNADAIAKAVADAKAAAEETAKAEINKIKAEAATEIEQAKKDADARVAQAVAEAQQVANEAITEAAAAEKKLENFSTAKVRTTKWGDGTMYRSAIFSSETHEPVPKEVVRAIQQLYPTKWKELLESRACAETDGKIQIARIKSDPDKFIEELPLIIE